MYTAPAFLFNAHLETIYPSLLRRVGMKPYTRERICTPDDDFLDLDWLTQGASKLIIISHGLEGSSQRPYVKGLAKAGFNQGCDILAWNFRGCSGEINKQLRFYHSGATEDLHTVLEHVKNKNQYTEIFLMGFSLGGNLTLKYLGERQLFPEIKKSVVFSVPLNLQTSCARISEPSNWIYARRFLKSLKQKILRKHIAYPELNTSWLPQIKTIQTFDDRYTAPLHGYNNAAEYYDRCSSIHFIHAIPIPTLIINARNDPFLSNDCYPTEMLKHHANVKLETPDRGGHVGFAQFHKSGLYWSEEKALQFIK
ncbi:MAG TPA: alpha/beta fold hydrolase [Ohtaekwangia sp.]|nr:alpha/beta fold hydrolase [Ohtaekwangia sp.]